MFGLYLAPLILIVYTVFLFFYNKKYLLLSFTLLASFTYLLIAILTFANGDGDVMMEKTFMPFLFMFIVPFTTLNVSSNNTIKATKYFFITFLIVVSFNGIFIASKNHTERLNILTEALNKTNYPKVIANYKDFDEEKVKFNNWGTGIETVILAKCKLNKLATLYLVEDKWKFDFDKKDSSLFLSVTWWNKWNINQLDSNYFKVPNLPYKPY